MRTALCCLALAVAGCLPDFSYDYFASTEGIWDGQALTIKASYHLSDGGPRSSYSPASVTATLRGETYALEQTFDPAASRFERIYYQAIIPLESPPDGEEVIVEPAGPPPKTVFALPPSFEIAPLPPPPIDLPLTIQWTPSATNLMEWTASSDCIGTNEPARVDYSDVNYLDAGMFTFSVGSSEPTPCDFTLVIDRHHYHSSTPELQGDIGTQRRTVTFTANLETP